MKTKVNFEVKRKCMELLEREHSHVLKTDEDLKAVFRAVESFIAEIYLESFIENSLNVFESSEQAFNWFQSDEGSIDMNDECLSEIKVTENMVGKPFGEAVKIAILESKENYMEVNDHIYLTYWM